MGQLVHDEKVKIQMADLAKRGENQYTAAPPLFRAAWALGIPVPPPHFMNPVLLAALGGGLVGSVGWGIVAFSATHVPFSDQLYMAGFAGGSFGVALACFFRWDASRLGLKSWTNYPAGQTKD